MLSQLLNKSAAISTNFPLAGKVVDGLTVGDDIDNMSSISASMYDYEIEDGIREVPMSAFNTYRLLDKRFVYGDCPALHRPDRS